MHTKMPLRIVRDTHVAQNHPIWVGLTWWGRAIPHRLEEVTLLCSQHACRGRSDREGQPGENENGKEKENKDLHVGHVADQ